MRLFVGVAPLFLLMINKTRVTTTARNKAVPTIAPAMPAADMGGDEELAEDAGEVPVGEGPGGEEVEEGERLLMHELSSETPTVLRSELPP